MRLNHIGIVVQDIQKETLMYQRMGYLSNGGIIIDRTQMNKVVILYKENSPTIELIEAVNEMSTIFNFKKGYHHICFEAEPEENIIKAFSEMKVGKIFTGPIIAPALNNREVVFACLRNGSFVELIL